MNTPDSVISKMYYKNVYILTKAIPPSKEFERHFKEGMFDKPNTVGFIHVSHYLLNVYNEEHFKSNIEWPLFDKRSEAKYRNDVKDFMVVVADENKDLEFPSILTSHLVTAGGRKFLNLMYRLSQAALRAFLRKSGVVAFAKPKSTHPIAKVLLTNTIAKETSQLKDYIADLNRIEAKAKAYAENAVESIEVAQNGLLEKRQELLEIVNNLNLNNEDVKKKLLNTNDSAVIEEWNLKVNIMLEDLTQKSARVKKIREKSREVANLVKSLCSDSKKVLDGKDLPIINTQNLMDKLLDPTVQVALRDLYQDGKLNLNNMFIVLTSVLNYYRINIKHLHSPHLSEYNQQIIASTEDLKIMITVTDTIQNKIEELLNEVFKMIASSHPSQNSVHTHINNEIFHSDVLKASPTIQLKNYEPNKNDIRERLQLTPVEHPQRELLTRYAQHNDFLRSNLTLERPKILITRINFDDSLPSTSRDESMSISRRSTTLSQSSQSIEARIGSRMADIIRGRQGRTLSNLKTLDSSQWRNSSLLSENHTIYDQRLNVSITSSVNNSLELSTPPRGSSIGLSISGNLFAIKNIGKPTFNSTVSDLTTIAESIEIRTEKESAEPEEREKTIVEQECNDLEKLCIDKEINNIEETDAQDADESKKQKEKSNKRFSIGDIVERYKKIRDQSICLPDLNFDLDNFNE